VTGDIVESEAQIEGFEIRIPADISVWCREAENRILFIAIQHLVAIPGSVDMKSGTITGKDETILIDETCIKRRDDS
jgi:hypothetical protein